MRIRKFTALVGAVVIFFGCIILYRMTDYTLYLQDENKEIFPDKSYAHRKTDKRPNETSKKTVEDKPDIKSFFGGGVGKWIGAQKNSSVNRKSCRRLSDEINSDIQMLEVYKELKFDNLDGGVWKQGWNVETDPSRWNIDRKLKVFVVPHSHNDPGWLKTFEDYYISETRNILNNLLQKMSTDEKKKFIWAEISFLSFWWDELSQENQEKLKMIIQRGQLEIVTGGWVMNDEANAHYYSILTQLTEGHLWVKGNVDVEPKHAWTIDPFGESSVMPFIFKKMGLESLVIQRVHYSVKKYLAQTKNLEFRWRQPWDSSGENDLFTHMMPFYSYDVPHTCGPDPKICCQFDFKRLPGHGVSCPWKEPPKPINKKNVAVRAQMLLDQYRKKSELYRTNVVLAPLGDDFRYQYSAEWDNQFDNYYKIFDYLNNNPSLHVEAKFGTLSDFFNALLDESTEENFPTLTGDFFTYADRDDHYWSGYFTSRPYYKRMDRILMNYIRAADILYALGWGSKKPSSDWLLQPQVGFAKMLRDARRSLSLFQHHDAVTGTARDNVMEDYAKKMLDAIKYAQHVIQQTVHFLMSPLDQSYIVDSELVYFDFDDHRRNTNSLPERKLLIFREGEAKRLVFFNPLTYKRKEVVSIQVFSPYVQIMDSSGNEVPCQASPVFSQGSVMDDARFEIFFVAEVPALALNSYTVVSRTAADEILKNTFSKVKIFNAFGTIKKSTGFEDIEISDGREFSIENREFQFVLSDIGLLKSVTCKTTSVTTPLHLDFVRYLARRNKETSGAYLFLPEGEADIVRVESPLIKVYEGPIYSRVEVSLPNVKHIVTLYNSPSIDSLGLEIVNVVDIKSENNYELAMRITSHITNGDEFYTDLNGLNMIKRKRFAKLPLQGNFYPMPTAAYIEDSNTRLTILSAQPLGVSSLKQGHIEILQDRRLTQDDNRGLGQGVLDNRPTPTTFRLMVEQKSDCKSPQPLLSVNAFSGSQSLLHPFIKMIWKPESPCDLQMSYAPVQDNLGSDIHLVSMRTLDEEKKPSAGMVFLRQHLDKCFYDPLQATEKSDGVINFNSFLPDNFGDTLKKASLSFLKEEEILDRKNDQVLCHMDFLSVVISR